MAVRIPSRLVRFLDWLFPTARAARRHRIELIEQHRTVVEQLTSRLELAQKAKIDAEKRADVLREEKERLRERLRALKKEIAEANNKNEILGERVTALQILNEQLAADLSKE